MTRAAERLQVSQSPLSIQLGQFENTLGQKLFEREDKRSLLTKANRFALDYANSVFQTGDKLFSEKHGRSAGERQMLRDWRPIDIVAQPPARIVAFLGMQLKALCEIQQVMRKFCDE